MKENIEQLTNSIMDGAMVLNGIKKAARRWRVDPKTGERVLLEDNTVPPKKTRKKIPKSKKSA